MKKNNSKVFIIIAIASFVLPIGGYLANTNKQNTYQNPVGEMTNIGDPFILKDNKHYYLYATSEASVGFKVWQSDNLIDWVEKGLAYDHRNQDAPWATGDFWAPEVIKYQDQYIMIYSAREFSGSLKMTIATSDNPIGPFKDKKIDITEKPGSYIDGHIFIDEGIPYLYYVKDNFENIVDGKHVSQIFVQEMTEDLLKVKGQPVLLLKPDQAWETPYGDFQWNEGPFVLKNNNKYYLMYSANFYASADYAIGYAVSDSPMGPFKKSRTNPILSKDLENGISGPGHNSVTMGLDNKTLYVVYHIHTNSIEPSGDRRMAIDRLYFEDKEMKIDGPTHDKQKLR